MKPTAVIIKASMAVFFCIIMLADPACRREERHKTLGCTTAWFTLWIMRNFGTNSSKAKFRPCVNRYNSTDFCGSFASIYVRAEFHQYLTAVLYILVQYYIYLWVSQIDPGQAANGAQHPEREKGDNCAWKLFRLIYYVHVYVAYSVFLLHTGWNAGATWKA